MRGMILAAGRGERMGHLTIDQPKPLLNLNGRFLIEYSINALVNMGIKEIVINLGYHGSQIKQALGHGSRYGISIAYSEEFNLLETGGGIYQALPLLGDEPFVVLSADVVSDFPLERLPKNPPGLAHLVLVDNPSYHRQGDFCLQGDKIIQDSVSTLTFSNIGIYKPELFAACKPGKFRLGSLIRNAISQEKVTGEYYQGIWYNLGTPEELEKARQCENLLNVPLGSHF